MVRSLFIFFALSLSAEDTTSFPLTLLHVKEGDEVEANRAFLDSLEQVSVRPVPATHLREKILYQKALKELLDSEDHLVPTGWVAKIQKELEENPSAHRLRFFLALAAQEKGDLETFYREFMAAYTHFPGDFLSYKTKGELYASLYEHARTQREKDLVRLAAFQNVSEALEIEPKDIALQKMKIFFSEPSKKGESIRVAVDQIGVIPLEEVRFFVVQAVDAGEKKLAQDVLDKAKGWYSTSRIIDRSQRYIDKK